MLTAAESLSIMPKIRQKKPVLAATMNVLVAETAKTMMSAIAGAVMTVAKRPERNMKAVVAENISRGLVPAGIRLWPDCRIGQIRRSRTVVLYRLSHGAVCR